MAPHSYLRFTCCFTNCSIPSVGIGKPGLYGSGQANGLLKMFVRNAYNFIIQFTHLFIYELIVGKK